MPRACAGQRDTMQTHAERDSEDNTCGRRLTPYKLWWNMLPNVPLTLFGRCATPWEHVPKGHVCRLLGRVTPRKLNTLVGHCPHLCDPLQALVDLLPKVRIAGPSVAPRQRDTLQAHAEHIGQVNVCRMRVTPCKFWQDMLRKARASVPGLVHVDACCSAA